MPKWILEPDLQNADCRFNSSMCDKGKDTYSWFRDMYGSECVPPSGTENGTWWNIMALDGLNGAKATPNSDLYRGNHPIYFYFSKLGSFVSKGKSNIFQPSQLFRNYSENSLLMFLIDRFGPIQIRFLWSPNSSLYASRRSLLFRNGSYNNAQVVYGADMLLGQELGNLAQPAFTRSGGNGAHSVCIVGYRYIIESPESSYWIVLNSHGASADQEIGFEYYRMEIFKRIRKLLYLWLPAMYWNKFIGPQPFEDGEIDEVRKGKYYSCVSAEYRAARGKRVWTPEENVSIQERNMRDSQWGEAAL
jgi:hypothetical protein